MKYKVIKTKSTAIGRFDIVEHIMDLGGQKFPYSYIKVRPSVAVLAKNNDNFIFIRQYRETLGEEVLEIPGGAVDIDEEPQQAARRELREETGFETKSIQFLGQFYPSVGISDEICYVYYIECGRKTKSELDALEIIDILELTEEQVEEAINTNELKHSMALFAWLKYKKRNMIC